METFFAPFYSPLSFDKLQFEVEAIFYDYLCGGTLGWNKAIFNERIRKTFC